MSGTFTDQPESDDDPKSNRLSSRAIVLDLSLWALLVVLNYSQRHIESLAMPPWLRMVFMVLWCGLVGDAFGGLTGRIVKGAIIGALIGPIVVIVLFMLAFIGG